MGSRYGKTMPILLAGIAILAVCVAVVLVVRKAAETPPAVGVADRRDIDASASGEGPRETALPPDVPPAPLTAVELDRLDAARLRLAEIGREQERVERDLQAARYEALRSNPELQKRIDESRSLTREVETLLTRLPERIRLDQKRDRDIAERTKIRGQIEALNRQVAEGRKAHAKTGAEGQPAPVDEGAMRQWLTELRQLEKEDAVLHGSVMAYFTEVKKLELYSKQHDPEISKKAAEAEQVRREVSDAISNMDAVAGILEKRNALIAEGQKLMKECAALGSRSNRVAMAAEAGEKR